MGCAHGTGGLERLLGIRYPVCSSNLISNPPGDCYPNYSHALLYITLSPSLPPSLSRQTLLTRLTTHLSSHLPNHILISPPIYQFIYCPLLVYYLRKTIAHRAPGCVQRQFLLPKDLLQAHAPPTAHKARFLHSKNESHPLENRGRK